MTYKEVLALTQANSKAIDKLTASVAELSANARAEQARREEENARRDKQRAEENAQRDKESAERDKQIAEENARRDEENARRDKQIAEENARRDEENARRDKQRAEENARRDEENAQRDKQRAEENARRDKQDAERAKKFAATMARWDKFMERYGGYVDNDGRKVENFFIEGLKQLDLVVGDVEFDEIISNAQHWRKKVVAIELDALLINGTTVGILEVKSTLHRNDVLKVKDSLIPRFRKFYPEYQKKELAVMVAGELINPDAAELAHELGYIVLKPNNQGLSVDTSGYKAA